MADMDTAAKRFSCLNWGTGSLLPIPDGSFDAADRLHLLDAYNSLGGSPPVSPSDPSTVGAAVTRQEWQAQAWQKTTVGHHKSGRHGSGAWSFRRLPATFAHGG